MIRTLTQLESTFISKAGIKIAELAVVVNDTLRQNDVDFDAVQLIIELEEVIKNLQDPQLVWTEHEISKCIAYYTLVCDLYSLPFKSYLSTPVIPILLKEGVDERVFSRVEVLALLETVKGLDLESIGPNKLLITNDAGDALNELCLSDDFEIVDVEGCKTLKLKIPEVVSVPIITLLGENPYILPLNDNFQDPGVVALDSIDGVITTDVVIDSNINSPVAGEYRVIYSVTNSQGNSANPVVRTVVVVSNASQKAPELAVVVNALNASLQWSMEDYTNVISYTVEYKLASENWSSATTFSTGDLSYTLPNLEEGTYVFRVIAVIDVFPNLTSNEEAAVIEIVDNTPPTTPVIEGATVDNSGIIVTWTESTDDEGSVSYELMYTALNDSNWANSTVVPTSSTIETIPVNSGAHKFRVRAKDSSNNYSPYSNIGSASISDTEPPTVPQNILISVEDRTIGLYWEASTDNVAVEGYEIQFKLTNDRDAQWNSNIFTTTIPELVEDFIPDNYTFRIRAKDTSGNYSAYSEEVLVVVENDSIASNLVYYGQMKNTIILTGSFFEQINGDSDNYINNDQFTLRADFLENQASQSLIVPYLGSPYGNQQEIEKVVHFFAMPIGYDVTSSENQSNASDAFYRPPEIDKYTRVLERINGMSYVIWIMTQDNPLGGNVKLNIIKTQ